MSDDNGGLTILELHGQNVKRVRAVRIAPTAQTGLVKIAGRNDQGKSSTLDLIELGLRGKSNQPAMPIRRGATSAKDVIDLQGRDGKLAFRLTRTWTASDTYLTVERAGVGKIKSPQEFLDGLVGAGLGFDPLEFVGIKPPAQVAMLLDALKLKDDPRDLDGQKKILQNERTLVEREVRTLKARLEDLAPTAEDAAAPDAEISVSALLAELDRLRAVKGDNDAARLEVSEWNAAIRQGEANVATAEQKLTEAEKALADAKNVLGRAREHLSKAEALAAALVDPDLAAVRSEIETAETTNARVRARRARAAAVEALEAKRREAKALGDRVASLDDRKREMLAAATFPVPGLSFEWVNGDYVITVGGCPIDQCATSVQIRVGMALAMALNPSLRVVLIRQGSLLDADSMAMVERMATEGGFQVWVEIVGAGDEASFVIEDGEIVREPKRGVAG